MLFKAAAYVHATTARDPSQDNQIAAFTPIGS
jgi:hypothetical protein